MTNTQHPIPIVGCFLFNRTGKLLIIRTHKWGDRYGVPGGHIEWGETMVSALKREMSEELGITDLTEIKLLCALDYLPDSGQYYKPKHMIFLNFKAKTQTETIYLNDEAESYQWIIPKEALKLSLDPYTRKTIETYLL